jgi:hypothetical protein
MSDCYHEYQPLQVPGKNFYICPICNDIIRIKSITHIKDSRWKSATEVAFNTAIGFIINFLANYLILPHYGVPANPEIFLVIGVWYTLISIIRAYGLRRFFESMGKNENFYTLILRLKKKILRK